MALTVRAWDGAPAAGDPGKQGRAGAVLGSDVPSSGCGWF